MVTVVGCGALEKERAIEGFAKMTGRGPEDSKSAVEKLDECGQLIGVGMTREEAEWLDAWLEEHGLESRFGIYTPPPYMTLESWIRNARSLPPGMRASPSLDGAVSGDIQQSQR